MKTFTDTLNEVMWNATGKRHSIPDGEKADLAKFRKNSYTESPSSTGQHTIFTKHGMPHPWLAGRTETHHYWVHNKTGHVEFHLSAKVTPSKTKGEALYSDIDSTGRIGAGVGKHAYYDLMSGRAGDAAIMVHDNQSTGATKLRRNIRKRYKDKVLYHTYDPNSGEAKHLTHGVSSSFASKIGPMTPYRLHKKIGPMKIVGMVPKKHRYVKESIFKDAARMVLGETNAR